MAEIFISIYNVNQLAETQEFIMEENSAIASQLIKTINSNTHNILSPLTHHGFYKFVSGRQEEGDYDFFDGDWAVGHAWKSDNLPECIGDEAFIRTTSDPNVYGYTPQQYFDHWKLEVDGLIKEKWDYR